MPWKPWCSPGSSALVGTVGTAASMRATSQDGSATAAVTFNKDVLPVLQKNCQRCHRPGEVAPMSLLTCQDGLTLA